MAEFYCYAEPKSGIRFTDAARIVEAAAHEPLCLSGGYHTGDDWGLYWTDFSVTTPEVETYSVNVPGRHGILDLSEVLVGHPVYKNCTLTAEFVANIKMVDWHKLYRTIRRAIHGKRMCIALDTDLQAVYVGRCVVSSEMADAVHCVFTITADIAPYTYGNCPKQYGFLWDWTVFQDEPLPDPILLDENGEAEVLLTTSGTQTARADGSKILYGNVDIYTEQDCTLTIQGDLECQLTAMGDSQYCNQNVYAIPGAMSKVFHFSGGTPGTQLAIFCRYQELL